MIGWIVAGAMVAWIVAFLGGLYIGFLLGEDEAKRWR